MTEPASARRSSRVVLLLSVLLLALASPAPQPTSTNPFNLNPVAGPPLQHIGSTRTRPVCVALLKAVKPALEYARSNDADYTAFQSWLYDYEIREGDEARDLRIVQMDHKIDLTLKNDNALKDVIDSTALMTTISTSPDDAKQIHALHDALLGIYNAQKVEENVMSGFVETERATRFGRHDESQKEMEHATGPGDNETLNNPGGNNPTMPQAQATDEPNGFLRPTQDIFRTLQARHSIGLADQRMLQHDLTGIEKFTGMREDQFTKILAPAVDKCK